MKLGAAGLHSLEGYPVVEPLSLWKFCRSERRWTLLALALLAASVSLVLSPPGMDVWAWYQSPVSPVPTQPAQPTQTPAGSPTVPAVIPTLSPEISPTFEAAQTPDTSQTPGRSGGTAMLVVGLIVLAGLIVGAVVLLTRGQPPDESI